MYYWLNTHLLAVPPVTRSDPETFVAYADECERRAQAVADRRLKELFRDLAIQWRSLATTVRLLRADERERESFFNGSHIPPASGLHSDP
jgi:hypothetical protein